MFCNIKNRKDKKIPSVSGMILLLMLLFHFTGLVHGQQNPSVVADFEVQIACKSHTVLRNTSYSVPADTIKGYLWEIFHTTLGDPIVSTTENPCLAFDYDGTYEAHLTVFTDIATADTTKIITISNTPDLDIIEWSQLVCSNKYEAIYEIDYVEGYSYHWELNPINDYIVSATGTETSKLEIDWGQLNPQEARTVQLNLVCTVKSDQQCEAIVSEPVILLSSSVPARENIQLIPKSNDQKVLFCAVENPELFLFKWGYVDSEGEDQEISETADNYFQYDTAYPIRYVTVVNKEYSYCTTRVEYESGKNNILPGDAIVRVDLLKIYPNPSTDMLYVDLIRHTNYVETGTISVFDFMGNIQQLQKFELAGKTGKIDVSTSSFSNGHYYLKIDVPGQQPLIEKFIVINNR